MTRLRMLADIGVRPAVEPALLHPDQIIGRQIVAEPVPLLHDRPQFAGLRMEGERSRVNGTTQRVATGRVINRIDSRAVGKACY